MKYFLIRNVVIASLIGATYSLDNGVGLTPPMGWLSWQRFRCITDCDTYPDDCISEKLYMDMAHIMATEGFLAAGYNYVNVDDCWAEMSRDKNNTMVGDLKRFPSGMKALGDFLHSNGLKYGIYSDVGPKTCGGYPGSLGFEDKDAETFTSWGVDSLKLDGCNCDNDCFELRYPLWATKLNETGRAILYECSWPAYIGIKSDFATIEKNCNYWRPFDDINDNWDDVVKIIDWWGDNQDVLNKFSKSGAFNDPDMLIIGDYALSYDESKVQMSLWAIMMAPLFMSNDLRTLPPFAKEILLNTEVIAVNQDPMCVQGRRVKKDTNSLLEWWTRPLSDGSFAVAIFFRSGYGNPIFATTDFATMGFSFTSAHVRDLWQHKDLGVFEKSVVMKVNPHGVVMLKVSPHTPQVEAVYSATQ